MSQRCCCACSKSIFGGTGTPLDGWLADLSALPYAACTAQGPPPYFATSYPVNAVPMNINQWWTGNNVVKCTRGYQPGQFPQILTQDFVDARLSFCLLDSNRLLLTLVVHITTIEPPYGIIAGSGYVGTLEIDPGSLPSTLTFNVQNFETYSTIGNAGWTVSDPSGQAYPVTLTANGGMDGNAIKSGYCAPAAWHVTCRQAPTFRFETGAVITDFQVPGDSTFLLDGIPALPTPATWTLSGGSSSDGASRTWEFTCATGFCGGTGCSGFQSFQLGTAPALCTWTPPAGSSSALDVSTIKLALTLTCNNGIGQWTFTSQVAYTVGYNYVAEDGESLLASTPAGSAGLSGTSETFNVSGGIPAPAITQWADLETLCGVESGAATLVFSPITYDPLNPP